MIARPVDGGAHQLAEAEQHLQRPAAVLHANQRRDRVERVEEKVRMDFETQRLELGARQRDLETRLPAFEGAGTMVRAEGTARGQEQDEDEQVDQQDRGDLLEEGLREERTGNRQERLQPHRQLRGDDDVKRAQAGANQACPAETARLAARSGQPVACLQHGGGGEAPEQPVADMPGEDAQEFVPVAEHRQIDLRRARDADCDRRATGHQRHPTGVEHHQVAVGLVRVLPGKGHDGWLGYAVASAPANGLQPMAVGWPRMVRACRERLRITHRKRVHTNILPSPLSAFYRDNADTPEGSRYSWVTSSGVSTRLKIDNSSSNPM